LLRATSPVACDAAIDADAAAVAWAVASADAAADACDAAAEAAADGAVEAVDWPHAATRSPTIARPTRVFDSIEDRAGRCRDLPQRVRNSASSSCALDRLADGLQSFAGRQPRT
jgi:hypothetical protein